MNRPATAIDAISPAIQRAATILFRPFDLGKWFVLGFLTFLQMLGGGERYGGIHFPLGWHDGGWNWRHRRSIGWVLERLGIHAAREGSGSEASSSLGVDIMDWEESLRDGSAWFSHHLIFAGALLFAVILGGLALVILFVWLSSRATFCYIDCVATNRAEVVRPWKQYGRLADSYFFWRLLFSIIMLFTIIALFLPLLISLIAITSSGEPLDPWKLFFGGGVVVIALPVVLLVILAYLLVQVFLVDFIAPVQYVRGVRCGEAFRIVWRLIKANVGAFVLYVVMRVVIWLVLYFGLTVLGCLTCCALFCCWAIPVVGQTILQPIHVFVRSFPLYFLQGFGPGFDVFGTPALPAGEPGGASARSPDAGMPGSTGGAGFTGPTSTPEAS